MNEEIKKNIQKMIESKPVAIFMKGSPDLPRCRFSSKAIKILANLGVEPEQLVYFDVLTHAEVREGVKEFSNWPTIPQVYVGGEFVGGSDVLEEMSETGELQMKIKSAL